MQRTHAWIAAQRQNKHDVVRVQRRCEQTDKLFCCLRAKWDKCNGVSLEAVQLSHFLLRHHPT
jgi:hypothetical protein